MTDAPDPTVPGPPRDRPGTAIRGPWMIVATLGIALLTPLATVLIFRAVDDPADDRAAACLLYTSPSPRDS